MSALAVFAIQTPSLVHASGYASAYFGGEHGTVVTTNPTALYYNPAGLGFSSGIQLFIDGQLALRNLNWSHARGEGDAAVPAGFEGANAGTAEARDVFGAPMFGATAKLGNFAWGVAVYTPFGGEVAFDRNERFDGTTFPGAADGVARWHAYEVTGFSMYGTFGMAYRLGPLSIGVSGNLIWSTFVHKRAQDLVEGGNDLSREGRSVLDVYGVHGSFGVGAMLEAIEDTLWLGVSYQAQPGLGEMLLDGILELDSNFVSEQPAATLDVSFHQALPDITRLGARYKLADRAELRLALDVTRWSVLKTHCIGVRDEPCTVTRSGASAPDSGVVGNIRRKWKDTFGARGGGSYWIVPEVELFAGVGFETAAAPDETLEPGLADAETFLLALGGRFELGGNWFLAASYTHLQAFTRDNAGESELADSDVAVISRSPDAGGVYEQWAGLIDVNLSKSF